MANKKRKHKKNKSNKNIFTLIIVILVICVIGYFGFKSYQEISVIVGEIEQFTYEIPEELNDKIDLPTKINDQISIEWQSSNTNVISNTGVITQPSFEESDANVTLTGKINIQFKEMLSSTLIDILGIEIKSIEKTVKIAAKEATDKDKVESVINRLQLIEETYTSLLLPKSLCFDSIVINWDSLNDNIMSDEGKVKTPKEDTEIKLIANVSSNDYEEQKEFTIIILSTPPVLEVVDDNFDNQAPTSKYGTINSTSGVTYYNARIVEVENQSTEIIDTNDTVPTILKLRNKDGSNGSFEILNINNPQTFSFKYRFSGTQKKESSKLVITINTDGKQIVKEEIVKHTDEFTLITILLSEYSNVSINVEHIAEWKETHIDIDDVKVITKVSINEVKEWVLNNIPTSLSKSVILPFTTQYGGEIKWESNSEALLNNGIVNKKEQSQVVTLTGTICYLDKTEIITIEITIKGEGIVQSLEIYFIDIGKYGAGDCGESIYIKYGDIDIIVDAGDHFDATIQAVTEAINQRMEDDTIEYVIATHPDGDHIGGMAALFANFEIETLIKFEGDYTTQKYKKMETAYKNEGCDVYEIKSDIMDKNLGERFISLSNDVFISFVDTSYYTNDESNGKSIVFILEAYGTRVLMTGDADNASGHTDLEQRYQNQVGDIDILKVVHHGTANGTSIDFLNIVDPEVAIICNGNYLGNKHGHPTPTCLSNLYSYDSNMKVYAITGGGTIDGVVNKDNRTYKCSSEDRFNQRNGLITLSIDNNGYYLSSEYFGKNILEIKDTDYYKAIVANNLI